MSGSALAAGCRGEILPHTSVARAILLNSILRTQMALDASPRAKRSWGDGSLHGTDADFVQVP